MERFLERWKNEYDFKTFVTATLSLVSSVIFAVYNGFLGVYHSALWHGAICAYYIVLALLRGTIIISSKMSSLNGKQERTKDRVYLAVSILLLLLNICLILPFTLMVRLQKQVNMTMIPAIAMAAYTTFRIIAASVNLKKRKATKDGFVRLLRTIDFIDALVAILTLQNTLIMVASTGEGMEMMPLTATTSGVVWFTVLLLSVVMIVKGVKNLK